MLQFSKLSLVLLALLQCGHIRAQETAQHKTEPLLAEITASDPTSTSSGGTAIGLTLKLKSNIAIYTDQPHGPDAELEYLIPTTVQFFDHKDRVIDAQIQYPVGQTVKSPLGDFRVYSGNINFTATLPPSREAKYLRVSFAGYRYSDKISSGYS